MLGVKTFFLGSFDIRYFGFMLMIPVFRTFSRISASLPSLLSDATSPYLCIGALLVGTVSSSLVMLFLAMYRRPTSIRAKAIACLASGGIAFLVIRVLLMPVRFNLPASILAVFAYFAIAVSLVMWFLAWAEAYAYDGSYKVLIYISVSVFLGSSVQGWFNETGSDALVSWILFAAVIVSNCLLLSLARSHGKHPRTKHEDIEMEAVAKSDRWALRDAVRSSFTVTAIGFALCFFTWGVLSVPPLKYAQNHNAIVHIAGPLVAALVISAFSYSLRGNFQYKIVKQRAFFLIPIFAIFIAYFSFVRMLDSSGPLKFFLSVAQHMGVSGMLALFMTLIVMESKEKGACVEQSVPLAIILFAAVYVFGCASFYLLDNNAMYIQIVMASSYILALSIISTRHATINSSEHVEGRCGHLAEEANLSAREAEILLYFANGYSAERIADTLVISVETVRTHKKRIYAKLHIHKHEDLMALVRQH